MSLRSRTGVLGATGILIATMAWAPAAVAAPPTQVICASRSNDNVKKLLECVTLEGVREHQAALQEIADDNGGTRAAGTPGYEESVDYVVERMTAAGYNVTLNSFPFVFVPPSTLRAADARGGHVRDRARSPDPASGDVTAAVVPIDINLVPPRANTSGCDGAFTEAARRRPDRCGSWRSRRLRRLPGGRDRADPARRLQLRPQGVQRQCRRCRRRHHLQPGRHADCAKP